MVFTTRLKEHLHQHNVHAKDITKVLLLFKLCAWVTYVGLIPVCSKIRPLRRLVRMPVFKGAHLKLITKYPKQYARYEEHVLRTSEWFGSRAWVKWIPESFGQKHKDFGLAVAEATVIYKLTFFVWAPLEFMAIVRWYSKRMAPQPLIDEYIESYDHLVDLDLDYYSIDHINADNDDDDEGKGTGNNSSGGGSAKRRVGGRNASVTAFAVSDYSDLKVSPFGYVEQTASSSFKVESEECSALSSVSDSVTQSKKSVGFLKAFGGRLDEATRNLTMTFLFSDSSLLALGLCSFHLYESIERLLRNCNSNASEVAAFRGLFHCFDSATHIHRHLSVSSLYRFC